MFIMAYYLRYMKITYVAIVNGVNMKMDKFIDKITSDTAGDAMLLFAVLVLIFQLIRIML